MVAGLERDVGSAAAETLFGVLLSFAKGDDFGVVEEVVFMPALADHLAGAVEDDAANRGIGRGESDAAPGQFEGALHPVCVLLLHGHATVNVSEPSR